VSLRPRMPHFSDIVNAVNKYNYLSGERIWC
jgi:hypothetical protein